MSKGAERSYEYGVEKKPFDLAERRLSPSDFGESSLDGTNGVKAGLQKVKRRVGEEDIQTVGVDSTLQTVGGEWWYLEWEDKRKQLLWGWGK